MCDGGWARCHRTASQPRHREGPGSSERRAATPDLGEEPGADAREHLPGPLSLRHRHDPALRRVFQGSSDSSPTGDRLSPEGVHSCLCRRRRGPACCWGGFLRHTPVPPACWTTCAKLGPYAAQHTHPAREDGPVAAATRSGSSPSASISGLAQWPRSGSFRPFLLPPPHL